MSASVIGVRRRRKVGRVSPDTGLIQQVLNFHTDAVSPIISFLPNDCPIATAKRDGIDNREPNEIERKNET